jgi:uncharacterized iron-regulated membrane protein
MKKNSARNLIFSFHRILGLILGFVISIVGLTGSLLVFEGEIDRWIDSGRFGNITPVGEVLALDQIVEVVQTAYPKWRIQAIDLPISDRGRAFPVQMVASDDESHQVYIDPYTGKVLGDRTHAESYFSKVYAWHSSLAAGEAGRISVGIASGLLVVLVVTGVMLWPGWRKLTAGFKIKWNAHPKRLNFDLHKVSGITMAVFLSFAAFTGFCWTFSDWANPAIYALTLSPYQEEDEIAVMAPQPGQSMVSPQRLLQQAIQVSPSFKAASLRFPESETEPFRVYGKANEIVYLHPYTGNVLKTKLSDQEKTLGDRITGSFSALHLGTFAGLPSRILYLLVGLSPLMLFITGFIMWRNRKPAKLQKQLAQIK